MTIKSSISIIVFGVFSVGGLAGEIGIVLSTRQAKVVASIDRAEFKCENDNVLPPLMKKFRETGGSAKVVVLAKTGVPWDAICSMQSDCHKIGFRDVKCYLLTSDEKGMTPFVTSDDRQSVPDWFAGGSRKDTSTRQTSADERRATNRSQLRSQK